MTDVVLYFQVHQPFRLRPYGWLDVGRSTRWFDDGENARILRRVAARAYVPANAALLAAVERTQGRFRCAFSVSGTALDQMERYAPEALDGFVRLARTGAVEFLGETSHHSLAYLRDEREFRAQALAHAARVERLFGRRPTTFRNTELVVDERVARAARDLGYAALLCEGAERLLRGRSPRRVYGVRGAPGLALLPRSYALSDDVAFRFSDAGWNHHRLSAETFAGWLAALPRRDAFVGLFMDYETFGEHQDASSGILDFLARLPEAVLAHRRLRFATPAEVAARHARSAVLAIPDPVSWADEERDLTAWLGNAMQRASLDALVAALPAVRRAGRPDLLEAWRRLSTSDHLYYMCTKWAADGCVHAHFSPYATPHDAHLAYLNVLDDLLARARATRARRAHRTRGAASPRATSRRATSRRPTPRRPSVGATA